MRSVQYSSGRTEPDFSGIGITKAVRQKTGKRPWRIKVLQMMHNFGANGLLIIIIIKKKQIEGKSH